MPVLFTPFTLKNVTLRNRIVVPPMCQYSAENGLPTDWHPPHYAGLARGGAGLVIVEATSVSPEGRITPGCLGLWSDAHATALAPIAAAIKAAGAVPGIQIGHAGRKASANRPWEGDDHMAVGDPRGWETMSPSSLPFGRNLPRMPKEMTLADIEKVKADFAAAAVRAHEAGFEWLELHFAHGYLAHSFLSVHANRRTDRYGGTAENRGRFLLETLAAVRAVWPQRFPLTARLGVIEFDGRDEESVQEAIGLATAMRESGLDLLDVSLGFSTPDADIPWGPGFLAPVAARLGRQSGLPVSVAWGIRDPAHAERLVASGGIDLVMVGRGHLADPHFAFAAAAQLGVDRAAWILPAPYAHWLGRYGETN